MGVHELRSQAARTDTGVVLRTVDRETMRVDYGGRTMHVPVERGVVSYGFYLPTAPTWDDDRPVSPEDLTVIKAAIVEIQRHWGFDADFHIMEV